jgi:AGCS family alanine or glycine:cation symporter
MAELSLVWNLADLFMGFLCLTNLYAIIRLYKYAHVALNSYLEQKNKGIAEPVFDPSVLPSESGIHAWGVDKD